VREPPAFDCLELYALSSILRVPAAWSRLGAIAGAEVFNDPDARKLAAAILTGYWGTVEKSIPKQRVPTRLTCLIGSVLDCTVPGDNEEWAVRLVNLLAIRNTMPLAAAQLRFIADQIEQNKNLSHRMITQWCGGVIRLVQDGELNDDPRSAHANSMGYAVAVDLSDSSSGGVHP
jgi:hypothetical protein